MGKVDRLRNRAEPFAALFWVLSNLPTPETKHVLVWLTRWPPTPPHIHILKGGELVPGVHVP